MATRGLIAFREHRNDEGLALYLEAIDWSAKSSVADERFPAIASLYLAREMVLAQLEDADSGGEEGFDRGSTLNQRAR